MRDPLQEARENYKDAKEAVAEQYARIKEDFEFSNPANPKQWDDYATTARKGRPMHTLDRTNQFVQHVVNRQRESKTSADVLPADSEADVEVAKKIKGIIRHIEYVSRADIAWDTASDHQARGGLGWVRVLPKLTNPETNEQDILIQRVHDPLSCVLDPNSTEPDGSDALFGFAETTMMYKSFERAYPKAKKANWDSEGWFSEDGVRICEYFKVVEKKTNKITITSPERMTVTEDEYWSLSKQIGYNPPVQVDEKGKPVTFISTKREIRWLKMSGEEILEETTFPSQWIGIVPVLGHELWIEGKRFLCGLVRRLMDGQRLHNYEMSALTEAMMAQPKAPFLVSGRAIEGYEDDWGRLNSGNPAYLPYNDLDDAGNPVNQPLRLSPPNFPVAYANTANLAVQEMESSVGMYKSTFGMQSNAVSGRAKQADQMAGETATYHFSDNRRIAQQHVYRIIVDMLPVIYDNSRQARILGEDDKQSTVQINPKGPAKQVQDGKVVSINPGVGRYDVRVRVGPSYSTIREELGVKLQELGKGNPVLAATLTPMLMKLSDLPDADKITRVVIAMLPPEVQKAYAEEETGDLPRGVKAQLDQKDAQMQQMGEQMQQAGAIIQDLEKKVADKNTTVQEQIKTAQAQIATAQEKLKAQADALKMQEQSLQDAKTIAELQIKLQLRDAQETMKVQQEQVETEVLNEDKQENETLQLLAEAIRSANETMAIALQQNTQAIAQMQAMTVDAIEDMADVMSAPRDIKLQHDKNGRTVGARSIVLPEPNEMQ